MHVFALNNSRVIAFSFFFSELENIVFQRALFWKGPLASSCFSVCNMSFCFGCFKIFSLLLVVSNRLCCALVFFIFPEFGVYWATWICGFIVLMKSGSSSATFSSNIRSVPSKGIRVLEVVPQQAFFQVFQVFQAFFCLWFSLERVSAVVFKSQNWCFILSGVVFISGSGWFLL